VSSAARAEGPELPQRAELVRSELPATDRDRFDGELDEALDIARQTRDLLPSTPFDERSIRPGLPEPGRFGLADLRCRRQPQHALR
jgi:hypothetical protein